MIDWPRNQATRHLLAGPNLCLIARRQQLPSQPCAYFWIAEGLALDGVIRSDNRGSESLFPLRLLAEDGRANFAPEFVAEVEQRTCQPPSADDLLCYIYSLFHSPTYRERYAGQLRGDFPRILLPANGELFGELAAIGQGLIGLHLLRPVELPRDGVGSLWRAKANHDGMMSSAKDSRPLSVGLRVGGYDLPEKWLQPKHRSDRDPQFAPIAAAIDATQQQMTAIDAVIAQHGGFPCAFA